MNAKLIVLEGLDGSGKETQAKLLCNFLNQNAYKTKYVSFPNYNSKSSELVKMYLNGEISNNPNDINAYAASTFFSCDRYISYMIEGKQLMDSYDFIVCDRYMASNKIYQMTKIDCSLWDEFINWLEDLEYNKLQLPKPDLTLFLDVPIDYSLRLLSERYSGDDTKKDIHENNIEFLRKCYETAEYLIKREKWSTIQCVENGNLQSENLISEKIITSINTFLKKF